MSAFTHFVRRPLVVAGMAIAVCVAAAPSIQSVDVPMEIVPVTLTASHSSTATSSHLSESPVLESSSCPPGKDRKDCGWRKGAKDAGKKCLAGAGVGGIFGTFVPPAAPALTVAGCVAGASYQDPKKANDNKTLKSPGWRKSSGSGHRSGPSDAAPLGPAK